MALAFFSMGIFWFDIYKLKIIDDSISTCSLPFTRIARRSHHGNRGCFITSKCDAGYCLLTVRVAHKGNSFFVVVGCWLIVIMNHATVRETFMLHASKCMNPLLLCSFVSHCYVRPYLRFWTRGQAQLFPHYQRLNLHTVLKFLFYIDIK